VSVAADTGAGTRMRRACTARAAFDMPPGAYAGAQTRMSEPAFMLPASRPPIRVVLADDAFLVRAAIKHLLHGAPAAEVVGECDDATEVPRICDEQRADVLITDIRMPPSGDDEGIRLAARLRRTRPALGVIVLSTYADVTYALKLFESGADSRAYLLKDRIRDRTQLLDAVLAVAEGHSVIDPEIVKDLIASRQTRTRSRIDQLTPRELETLALIAQGYSNAAIAERLVLTKRAVEKHVNGIFAKLELRDSDHISRRVRATLTYLADRGALSTQKGLVSE
jgi:DNA-binding NarL/FixJ family response regulator